MNITPGILANMARPGEINLPNFDGRQFVLAQDASLRRFHGTRPRSQPSYHKRANRRPTKHSQETPARPSWSTGGENSHAHDASLFRLS
jgi:hypothetical protein